MERILFTRKILKICLVKFYEHRFHWRQSDMKWFMFRAPCLTETQSILGTSLGSADSVGPADGLCRIHDVLLARRCQPSPEEAWKQYLPLILHYDWI
jgi:hypothetical protein